MKKLSTPNDVIRKGMSLTGLHPDGDALHDDYLSDALVVLNNTLDEWSTYGIVIPYRSKLTIHLLPNKYRYQIHRGKHADLIASPIISIQEAVLHEGAQQTQLKAMPEREWEEHLQYTDNKGTPAQYLLNHDEDTSEIIICPTPDKSYQIVLTCNQRLSEMNLLEPFPKTDETILKALAYQLALDFSATYDSNINPLIERKAERMIRELLSIHAQGQSTVSSDEMKRHRT